MKFKFWTEPGKSIIKAIPEKQSEKIGFRAEGPYPKIEMVNDTAFFNFEIKEIHPDLLGMLCMLCFYPYCKDNVTFPIPVSEYFAKAFSDDILPLHEVIEGKYTKTNSISITNIDESISKYSGHKISISFWRRNGFYSFICIIPRSICNS